MARSHRRRFLSNYFGRQTGNHSQFTAAAFTSLLPPPLLWGTFRPVGQLALIIASQLER